MTALWFVMSASGCGDTTRQVEEWSPSDHQPPEGDPDQTAAAQQAPDPAQLAQMAAEAFRRECATCHGAGGQGDGPEAPTAMPDLTSAAFQDAREDADLHRTIRMGQGLMPAFGNRFNDTGIAALVAHVRSLRAQ